MMHDLNGKIIKWFARLRSITNSYQKHNDKEDQKSKVEKCMKSWNNKGCKICLNPSEMENEM